MAYTLIAFIFALLLLVTIHEYGHFIAARLCGVKVLRFSFGFGKVLARFKDKKGTEFAFSLLPLGGYVKMLDESEGEVLSHERHLAFNNKSVWARIVIVIAGPLMNILFAFFALWLVLVIGIKTLAPIVDKVAPDSIAARAGFVQGEEIIVFNERPVKSWRDVQFALLPFLGSEVRIPVILKSLQSGQTRTVYLNAADIDVGEEKKSFLAKLGITPFVPSVPMIVGEILKDSPASRSRLKVGDKIEAVNGTPLNDWFALVDLVQANPDTKLKLQIKRNDQVQTLDVMTGSQVKNGKTQGLLGVRSKPGEWPKQWLRYQRQTPVAALGSAFMQTSELTKTTFLLIARLVTGDIALRHISGPVGIAQGAGQSARGGLSYYLSFLALISISLGVLNLLPIPMLDGGHLLYYLVEVLMRRPVPDSVKSFGMLLGLMFLIALTVLAFRNDIVRLMY